MVYCESQLGGSYICSTCEDDMGCAVMAAGLINFAIYIVHFL